MVEPAMTVGEVATYLNANEKPVRRFAHWLAQKGELPAFRAASIWGFRHEDIDRWIESQVQAASGRVGGQDAPSLKAEFGNWEK